MPDDTRLDVYLICNAKYHDTNFARLELLKLLAEHEDVVVRVAEDYRDVEAIAQSRLLITYTCDVCPTVQQQDGLQQFSEPGRSLVWPARHERHAGVCRRANRNRRDRDSGQGRYTPQGARPV